MQTHLENHLIIDNIVIASHVGRISYSTVNFSLLNHLSASLYSYLETCPWDWTLILTICALARNVHIPLMHKYIPTISHSVSKSCEAQKMMFQRGTNHERSFIAPALRKIYKIPLWLLHYIFNGTISLSGYKHWIFMTALAFEAKIIECIIFYAKYSGMWWVCD